MSDNTTPTTPTVLEIQDRLHGVADLLRQSGPIDPTSRQALAELVDELGKALQTGQMPAAEVALLAETTAHLAESLHHQHEEKHLSTIRERFEQTLVAVEARAPFVSGLTRRLLDTLVNLGI